MPVAFGIDVSKATSQVAIVVDGSLTYHTKISNDFLGFSQLLSKLREYVDPKIVFEATGVYSRRLEHFFDTTGYRYTKLNPLAAKKQLDSLRPNKSDQNDARHLAETEFTFHRALTYHQLPIYQELMDSARAYSQTNEDVVRAKNRLHRVLQLTFPELESLFNSADGEFYWAVVQAFPHPDYVQALPTNLTTQIVEIAPVNTSLNRAGKIAHKLLQLAQKSFPAVNGHSTNVKQVIYEAAEVNRLTQRKHRLIQSMATQAERLPELNILLSIPGIAITTAVLLLGELGDIRRFRNSNCLNAYVGIDLRQYQSGEFVAAKHISKRGSKLARKILFRSISNIATVAHYHPCHINDFYQRQKEKQPPHAGTKKIAIAAIHRLLRTIYHLVINNQMYNYQIAKAN